MKSNWNEIDEIILEIEENRLVKKNWWNNIGNWWRKIGETKLMKKIDQMKLMKRNWSNEIDQMKLIKLNLKFIFNIFKFQPENSFKRQPAKYDDYEKSVRELLFFTSELSEGQKAISEFFDDKIKSVMATTLHIGNLKK